MKAIVGLGNPGKKFEKTRHNVGFLVIENLKLKIENFSDWENNKKLLSEISEGEIANQKIILIKPQAFMNNSGKSVKMLNTKYKIQDTNLFVIHDDIDIPLGKIRISKGRSSAGHKGIESIIKELGTKNFVRFRIGIKPEKGDEDKSSSSPAELPVMEAKVKMGTKSPSPFAIARVIENRKQKTEKFVLEKFSEEEEKILKEVIKKTVDAIEMAINERAEKAMNKYNK